jgi:hypothetical protein
MPLPKEMVSAIKAVAELEASVALCCLLALPIFAFN